ncbi:hypothetical protein ACFQ0K_04380 [Nocardioides caeni]|uniref:Uncharacterized protein n=1 Tax=Nocardioides caeni TaxID=574700 RepID=A0A4S8N578_9ACTN|nr:hypothetical protein [Nocardioides caeni]THV10751.1 hypothetical protein E9934_13510 [Nocardioides caeni]
MSEHTEPIDVERPRAERDALPRSGWHTVNVGHLVMGVAFVGLSVLWLLVTTDRVELAESHWLLPLPWLVAGAAGLVATMLRGRRRPDDTSDWRQQWKADQQTMKADLRRQKDALREDLRRHREEMRRTVHDWRHGSGHGPGH